MFNKLSVAPVSALAIVLAVGLGGYFASRPDWASNSAYGHIHADGKGYYGYLVAAFVNHSVDWTAVQAGYEKVYFEGDGTDFTADVNGIRVNKYYAGTALMLSPFFLSAHAVAHIFNFPPDGYSAPYQLAVLLAGLCYAALGLWLMRAYLLRIGCSDGAVALTVFALYTTTGAFYYSAVEPTMSHIHSFVLVCAFINLVHRYFIEPSGRLAIGLAAVLAIIVLVRPTNGTIVLMLPFLAGGRAALTQGLGWLWGHKRLLMLCLSVGIGILGIQSAFYLWQTGRPLVWAYSGEGFNFAEPHAWLLLFSFQKGFFVYTPWALLAMLGLPYLWKKFGTSALWWLGFMAISIYVISSWWNWYYGGSVGMRALIEYLPMVAIPFALLVHHLRHPLFRAAIFMLIGFFAVLNGVQAFQYNRYILHMSNMDRDRYFQIFMQTGVEWEGIYYASDRPEGWPNHIKAKQITEIFCDLEGPLDGWSTSSATPLRAFRGLNSGGMKEPNPYGPSYSARIGNLFGSGRRIIVAEGWLNADTIPINATIGFSIRSGERHWGHHYSGITARLFKTGKWTRYFVTMPIDPATAPDDVITIYPILNGPGSAYVDDVRFRFVTY